MIKPIVLEVDPEMMLVKYKKVLEKIKSHEKAGEFSTFEQQQQIVGYISEQQAIVFTNIGRQLGLQMAQKLEFHQGPFNKEDKALLAASAYFQIADRVSDGEDPFIARGRFEGVLQATKIAKPLVEKAIRLIQKEMPDIKW